MPADPKAGDGVRRCLSSVLPVLAGRLGSATPATGALAPGVVPLSAGPTSVLLPPPVLASIGVARLKKCASSGLCRPPRLALEPRGFLLPAVVCSGTTLAGGRRELRSAGCCDRTTPSQLDACCWMAVGKKYCRHSGHCCPFFPGPDALIVRGELPVSDVDQSERAWQRRLHLCAVPVVSS